MDSVSMPSPPGCTKGAPDGAPFVQYDTCIGMVYGTGVPVGTTVLAVMYLAAA